MPRALGPLYFVMGVIMFAGDWWPIVFGAKKVTVHDVIFPSIYLLYGGVCSVIAYRNFVRLSENRIEVSRFWKSQVLPFDKIQGRRKYGKGDRYTKTVKHFVIVPNDPEYPRIDLEESREFDESFYGWFNSLPDLDEPNRSRPSQAGA